MRVIIPVRASRNPFILPYKVTMFTFRDTWVAVKSSG